MGRLREKILPSLRAALEKLEENAETIPHEDSPHYLPRWDFSQSQARYHLKPKKLKKVLKLTGNQELISFDWMLGGIITHKG